MKLLAKLLRLGILGDQPAASSTEGRHEALGEKTPLAPDGGPAPAGVASDPWRVRKLPQPHPRAKQLIGLYERLAVHRAKLAEMQAEREGDATPIAEMIEGLERAEAEAAEAIARTVEAQVSLDDTIAEIAAELERLRGLREAAHDQAIELAQRRGRAVEELVAARARFDALMLPGHARREHNRVRNIERQIATIMERYPEARAWRLEQLIDDELVAMGVDERAGKVADAVRSQAFNDRFRDVYAAAPVGAGIAELGLHVLRELGVDAADVMVRAQVRPNGRIRWQVGGATGEARARALEAIAARRREGAEAVG